MGRGPIIAGRAVIIVQAQDNIQKSIGSIRASVMKMSNSIAMAGDQAMRGGLLGSIASGFLIKKFADFESSMLFLQTKFAMFGRLTGNNEKIMSDMEKTIRDLGSTTSYTAGEVAEAAVKLAQANLTPTQVTESLQAVLDLAKATRTELPFAADAIAKVIKTFKLNTADMPNISSMFVAATRLGPLDLEDLMMALRYSQSTGMNLKQSLPQMLAIFAEMSNKGMQSSIAGTSLNTAMGQISKKFKEMESIVPNFKVMFDEQGMFSYIGTLQSFINATKDMDVLSRQALTQDIFNLRGARSVGASEDVEQIIKFYEEIVNSQGEAAAAAKTMDSKTTGAIMRLSSAFDELVLAGGKVLSQVLIPFFETTSKILNQLSTLVPQYKSFVTAMLLIPPVALAGGVGLIMLAKGLRTVAGILGVVRSGFNAVFGSFAAGTSGQISAAIALYKSLKSKMPKLTMPGMGLSAMAVPAGVGRMQQAAISGFNKMQGMRANRLLGAVHAYWKQHAALKAISQQMTALVRRYRQYLVVQQLLSKEQATLRNLRQLALVMPSVKLQMAPVIANIARFRSQLASLALKNSTGQFVSFSKAIGDLKKQQMGLVTSMKALANIGGGRFAKFFKQGLGSNTLSQMARKRFSLKSMPALFPTLNANSFDVKLLMHGTAALDRMSKAFKGLTINTRLFINAMAATGAAITNLIVPGSMGGGNLRNGQGAGGIGRAFKLWKDFFKVMKSPSFKFPSFPKMFAIKDMLPDLKTVYTYMGYLGDTIRNIRGGIAGGNVLQAMNPMSFLRGMAPIAKMGILDKLGKGTIAFAKGFMTFSRVVMRTGSITFGILRKVFSVSGLWTIAELLLLFGDKIPFVKDVMADFGKAFSASFAAIGRVAQYAQGPLALIGAGITAISDGFTGQGVNAIIDGVSNLAGIIRNQLISAWNLFFAKLGETWTVIRGIGTAIWQMFTALYTGISTLLIGVFGVLGSIAEGVSQGGAEQGIQKTLYGWVKYFVTEAAVLFSDLIHGIALLVEKLNFYLTEFVWKLVGEVEKMLAAIPLLGYKQRTATTVEKGQSVTDTYAIVKAFEARRESKGREAKLLTEWNKTNLAIREAFADNSPMSQAVSNMMERNSQALSNLSYEGIQAMYASIREEQARVAAELAQKQEQPGLGGFNSRNQRAEVQRAITAAMVGYSSTIIGNIIKYGKATEEKQLDVLEEIRDDQKAGLRQRGGVLLGQ